MTGDIKFGSSQPTGIVEELEAFRKNREVDHLIERALQSDSSLFVLDEVMNCVAKGPVSPKVFKSLYSALEPALQRGSSSCRSEGRSSDQPGLTSLFTNEATERTAPVEEETRPEPGLKLPPSKSLGRFVFVEDALPGNSKAESLCVSPNGDMLAYLTSAAASLQKVRGKYVRCSVSARTQPPFPSEQRPLATHPRIVNVVEFDPYNTYTLSLDDVFPDLGTSRLELIGVNRYHVYVIEGASTRIQLADIGVQNGDLQGSHDLSNDCGALFLDLKGQRVVFIDRSTGTLDSLSLSSGSRQSYALCLPPGLSINDLSSVAIDSSGSTGVILVSRRSDCGILLGLFRWPSNLAERDSRFEIRWIKQKEAWLDGSLEAVRSSPEVTPADGTTTGSAFNFIDGRGTVYALALSAVTDFPLDQLNPRQLFRAFPSSKGGKKAAFPMLAAGTERPILVSYDLSSEQVRVWDTASNQLLISVPCPFRIDSLELVAHDTLLITKSRSARSPRERLTVTFLDFLFLAGQSPTSLRADCLGLLEPLEAWSPSNPFLDLIRRLASFNIPTLQEASI